LAGRLDFRFITIISTVYLISSIIVGVLSGFSITSAQVVNFDDPILTVSTDDGQKNLTETLIRVAIADPGKPINGVYINSNATNPILDFKTGEIVRVSGLSSEYFGGLMLKVFLVNGNVVKIPPGSEFIDINFIGDQQVLYNTNDLETSQIEFKIPEGLGKHSYSLVIVTGEEELHYYTTRVRVN
jgi:hypothetical protein